MDEKSEQIEQSEPAPQPPTIMTAEQFKEYRDRQLASEKEILGHARCAKCEAKLGIVPDIRRQWICRQCQLKRQQQIALAPRSFYPGNSRIPYEKPDTGEIKGKAAKKAAKRARHKAIASRTPDVP